MLYRQCNKERDHHKQLKSNIFRSDNQPTLRDMKVMLLSKEKRLDNEEVNAYIDYGFHKNMEFSL